MRIVGTDPLEVERVLCTGELECPDCDGWLRPWGWARTRAVRIFGVEYTRRPRRGRCVACSKTHVLLGADTLLRRRDGVETIGAALCSKTAGHGHRPTATTLGVPVSTVRGWYRRFNRKAETIRAFFTVLAHGLDPLLAAVAATGAPFSDAVEAIGVAARAASLRLAPVNPWTFASNAICGRLLSNTS